MVPDYFSTQSPFTSMDFVQWCSCILKCSWENDSKWEVMGLITLLSQWRSRIWCFETSRSQMVPYVVNNVGGATIQSLTWQVQELQLVLYEQGHLSCSSRTQPQRFYAFFDNSFFLACAVLIRSRLQQWPDLFGGSQSKLHLCSYSKKIEAIIFPAEATCLISRGREVPWCFNCVLWLLILIRCNELMFILGDNSKEKKSDWDFPEAPLKRHAL